MIEGLKPTDVLDSDVAEENCAGLQNVVQRNTDKTRDVSYKHTLEAMNSSCGTEMSIFKLFVPVGRQNRR